MQIAVYAAFEFQKQRIIHAKPFWRSQAVFRSFFSFFIACECCCWSRTSSLNWKSVVFGNFLAFSGRLDSSMNSAWTVLGIDQLYVQGGTRSMLCIYLILHLSRPMRVVLILTIDSTAGHGATVHFFIFIQHFRYIYIKTIIIISTNQFLLLLFFLADSRREVPKVLTEYVSRRGLLHMPHAKKNVGI